MDLIRSVIDGHSGLYEYGTANYGAPLPFFMWPSVVLGIIVVYLLAIKLIMPAFMADRKPFQLRGAMLVYNALQMLVNLFMGMWIVYEALKQGDVVFTGCPRSTPALIRINLLWVLNKYCDLTETVFFVLRRKFNQVSFLHVYHHVVVIYYTFMAFVETPGGYPLLTGLMNTFVHAIMYAYYFASIWDKQLVSRYVNYKKRITQVQMVQFCFNMLYYVKPSIGLCEWPKYLAYAGCFQNGILFYLFANFYYHAYYKKQKELKTE